MATLTQTQSDPSSDPSSEASSDPSSPEWQEYYANASRRRRAIRKRLGRHVHVDERKRRRAIETAFMIGSVVLLGALTAIFHSVLTR